MIHASVAALAGLFLCGFGGLVAWFLARRFARARFLRTGYALMSAGGALFVAWAVSASLPVGVAAAALVAFGAGCAAIGAARKELRAPS